VIFVPLYGCAALLVREIARRARLGWVGIVVLAAAFGVVQAGIADQSLFSPDYRQIQDWDVTYRATLVPMLGLSAYNALGFVGGHVVGSICGPIALVEAARPKRASTPWLGTAGLVMVATAYIGASVMVLNWHLTTEDSHATAAQLTGASLVALALIAGAVLLGRRPRAGVAGPAPSLPRTFLLLLPLAALSAFAPQTWLGTAMTAAAFAVAAVLVGRLSRRQGWSPTHVAVVAALPLLATAALAFTYYPLVGDVDAAAKYAHNAVMLAIVLGATALAMLRRDRPAPAGSDADTRPEPAPMISPVSGPRRS
jgi:hypothetical protein